MWRGFLLVAVLVTFTACEDDDPVGPDTGAMEVEVTTTGDGTDPDGYTVSLDSGAETQAIQINDSVTLEDLEAGSHEVELTDVAANCAVAGDNPRSVTIESGATETVTFDVTCTSSG